MSKKQIINLDEVKVKPRHESFAATGAAADKFDAISGSISRMLGAQKLGYSLTVVPPGKSAFPAHNHHVNEEMFLILEGTGELRVGDTTTAVRKHDVIACPPGGPETAHQIMNNSNADLKYLAISTLQSPEYVEYPDSGKFGVYGERVDTNKDSISFVGRVDQGVDYWDGEG